MKDFIELIKDKAKKDLKIIVYPESTEPRILKAVRRLVDEKIVKPILIGDRPAIDKAAHEAHVNLEGIEVRDPMHDSKTDEYVKEFYEMRKAKGLSEEDAKKTITESNIYFATMMMFKGDADGLVSGSTTTTADTVRPALQIIKKDEQFHKVSSFFFMNLHGRILMFADCAVVIEPDAKDLADIAIDTVESAKKFGIDPKVAMLSFSTNGSAKHPQVDKVKEATAIVKDEMPDLVVDGEMQVDAALVEKVGVKKFPGSKLKGDANVLIFPDLASGNIAYKLVERLAKADAVGPILQGLKKPVNDLSRGCDVDDIIDVSAITAVEAQGSK